MKIWLLKASLDNYIELVLKEQNKENLDFLSGKFNCQPIGENWFPLETKSINKSKKVTDIPKFWDAPGAFVLSKKAVEVLNPFLKNSEILPLFHDKYNYYLINVLYETDFLDTDKSNSSDMFYLKNNKINCLSTDLFKATGDYYYNFVSDEFRQTVLLNKLKGFDFKKVWDSED